MSDLAIGVRAARRGRVVGDDEQQRGQTTQNEQLALHGASEAREGAEGTIHAGQGWKLWSPAPSALDAPGEAEFSARMRRALLIGVGLLLGCGRTQVYRAAPKPAPAACRLQVEPATLDFGTVRPGVPSSLRTVVENVGGERCRVQAPKVDGDPGFALQGAQPPFELAVGAQLTVGVSFTGPTGSPAMRAGRLRFFLQGNSNAVATVALQAELALCVLGVSPNPFDFGNVRLNTTATRSLTLSNSGAGDCVLSGFALRAGTAAAFSLPSPPPTLLVASGKSQSLAVAFTAFDSSPPHRRTGILDFGSNDDSQPMVSVPLSAFINTICTEAGQFIYTVDRTGTFSRFDPSTVTSTVVGQLACPTTSLPFSMNLDQSAVAWVVFDDGKLFTIDTSNAHCTATSYQDGQTGRRVRGMGFSSDTAGGNTEFLGATTRRTGALIARSPTSRSLITHPTIIDTLDLVLGNRRFGAPHFDFDPIALGNPLAQFQSLLELIARIEIENVRPRFDLGEHVDNDAPFGAKRGGHCQSRVIRLDRPPKDFPRMSPGQHRRGFLQTGRAYRLARHRSHRPLCWMPRILHKEPIKVNIP